MRERVVFYPLEHKYGGQGTLATGPWVKDPGTTCRRAVLEHQPDKIQPYVVYTELANGVGEGIAYWPDGEYAHGTYTQDFGKALREFARRVAELAEYRPDTLNFERV